MTGGGMSGGWRGPAPAPRRPASNAVVCDDAGVSDTDAPGPIGARPPRPASDLRPFEPDWSTTSLARRAGEITVLLDQAVAMIEELSKRALDHPRHTWATQLDEASFAVHKALIALDEYRPPRHGKIGDRRSPSVADSQAAPCSESRLG